MLPELSIERVFQRELDNLPLPDEQLWVPATHRRLVVVPVLAVAAVIVVVVAGFVLADAGSAVLSGGLRQTPQPIPTRGVAFLQTVIRNLQFGYNLTIPGEWRQTQMPPGTEPFVRDRPSAIPSLTAPFLLDRHVFTARPAQEWVALTTVNMAPAWDLDVQVWDRQGRTALEWATSFGPCSFDVRNYGTTGCVQTTETIHGTTFVKTTISTFLGPQTTSYYLERGDQMLILRYWIHPNVAPPPGVTTATLEGIVHSIGLV